MKRKRPCDHRPTLGELAVGVGVLALGWLAWALAWLLEG